MSDKFQNKYRIPSARLKDWDYGSNALYFVTICTKNREFYFGEIINGEMVLSDIGKMAHTEWVKTFELRPDMNLYMGEFVVMPNHFHGIIGIGDNKYNTQHGSQRHTTDTTKNHFGPQSKNLASIIRGFKSAVTQYAKINNFEFAWQSNFYDHIIRNDESFQRIANYITDNPSKWTDDKFFNGTIL